MTALHQYRSRPSADNSSAARPHAGTIADLPVRVKIAGFLKIRSEQKGVGQ